MKDDGAPRTARARVRDELTREITDVARQHLAEEGSSALSLRAIARELGMVSSAIYRYFPSRDDLLTALIVDAYSAVGVAAEQAEAKLPREDPLARWLAVAHAARHWAVQRPQEYALIFGSPIPGYKAPQDTIDPAARIPFLILQLVADAASRPGPAIDGTAAVPGSAAIPASRSANPPNSASAPRGSATAPPGGSDGIPLPTTVRADLSRLRDQLADDLKPALDEARLARGVMAWSELIGLISFELFGHLNQVIFDYEAHFDYQMRVIGARLGLTD